MVSCLVEYFEDDVVNDDISCANIAAVSAKKQKSVTNLLTFRIKIDII